MAVVELLGRVAELIVWFEVAVAADEGSSIGDAVVLLLVVSDDEVDCCCCCCC